MFTNLHNHFTGSFSDSTLRIEEAVKKLKSLGQNAVAITEHGEMPFVYEFSDVCKKYDIKPIFGVEIYFVDNAQQSIEKKDKNRFHLLLFAKNETGYRNLVSLVSDSWIKNNYYERRGLVDWELLEKYHEGVIASSACFFNQVSQAYIKEDLAGAEKIFLRYKSIFGGDFYAELGRHEISDEEISNKGLIELAKKNNVKLIATNDVHYLEIDDWLAHDLVIRTRFDKISSFKMESHHYWLKSEEEMLATGIQQEYLDNTQEIVDKCEFRLKNIVPVHYKDIDSIDTEIKSGNAAYLSEIEYIENDKANYYVENILGKNHPDNAHYVERISGLPRKLQPNTDKIAYLPDIKEKIPLKIVLGKIITQFTQESCKRAGASIQSVVRSSLADALFDAKKIVKNVFE
ncbi:MAG: PHP domain-containing protein [Elusimicrobia bacterium]|nr:PHP domain-containing protein [Elusimicrobiota bacterium]